MKKLIKYSETPQVTALEYSELRDLKEHPEKRSITKMLCVSVYVWTPAANKPIRRKDRT